LTPLQPYTPPHLDPISPAIVSRDYWKFNPRQTTDRDKRHGHHSSSRRERHSRKRERSPEERHHRHQRSEKRRRHSSRHDRERRRRHRSTDHDDNEDEILYRPQLYVDPALVPDPLAIAGNPVRISPRKQVSKQTSVVSHVAKSRKVLVVCLLRGAVLGHCRLGPKYFPRCRKLTTCWPFDRSISGRHS
jgi:hypothetical protein